MEKEIADLRNQLELNSPPPDHPSAAVPQRKLEQAQRNAALEQTDLLGTHRPC